jgi:hypothetical protein
MHILRVSLVGLLVLSIAMSSSAFAQERHVVDPDLLTSTVDEHVATQEADRAAVRQALSRPEVQEVATRIGLDLNRVATSIDTMNGRVLTEAARTARQVNHALVGGATVTISTTTIIIALLVVILIIVAVK